MLFKSLLVMIYGKTMTIEFLAFPQSFLHIKSPCACGLLHDSQATKAKHLLLAGTRIKQNWRQRENAFLSFFICRLHLITGWQWYISVTHRKRIIFQWKPKPYCWECTIWISKGFALTSIFSGIEQESAPGGKTDWWWIMYTFGKLWYLSNIVMLHMTYPNHQHDYVANLHF